MGREEKKIFILHMVYSIIEGVLLGILALNEIVFIKSLGGSEYLLGFLVQFSTLVLIVTIVINEIVKRYKKKKILRLVAMVTRLPMLVFLFFPGDISGSTFYHMLFLFTFLLFFSAKPFILPAINQFLKQHYREGTFGRRFGYASTANKISILVATFAFGLLLDYDGNVYRYVYPAMSLLSLVSLILVSLMDNGSAAELREHIPMSQSIKNSFSRVIGIIRNNRAYRDFEVGFMIYGIAFLTAFAVIPVYLVDGLGLNYTSVAIYKNSYNTFAIFLLPAFGKMIDRIDPRKFAMLTFLSLLLFNFFLGLAEYIPDHTVIDSFGLGFINIPEFTLYYSLVPAYLSYGFFAAMMGLVWSIGSSYFCRKEEAGDYQSVHLSMVGARSVFAPLFGIWVYKLIGFTGVFAICVVLLGIAIIYMQHSMKKDKDFTEKTVKVVG